MTPQRKAAQRAWYAASPEGKASHARYDASQKGKANRARNNAKRRSRLKALLVCDLTAGHWDTILQEHKYSCHYCGSSTKKLTRDHVVPISKGGQHTASNIVPACQSCNSSKGATVL